MSIRGFSPIIGLYQKAKLTVQPRSHKSGRTHSEKKFTPKINKSFTCYNEPTAAQPANEKSRYISFMNLKPRNKSFNKYRTLRSSPKFNQNPIKKEVSSSLVEKAENLYNEKNFQEAAEVLEKILKDDPLNPSALLVRGKIHTDRKFFKEAIVDLNNLIENFPGFDRSAFVLIAMNFVALGDYSNAIRKLTKGISKFSKFKEGLMARGQLFNHQQLWDKGAGDFLKVIQIKPEEENAYLGLADSLAGMKDYEKALKVLKSGKKFCFSSRILMKTGKIYFELNQPEKALKTFNKSIKLSPLEAEIYYQKALVYLKLDNMAEAALCLEQVIKFDQEKKYTGPAIFDLGAIKIKQKDYYGAMHTFQRAMNMKVDIKPQKLLEKYVEAVLTLMKRKFKDGSNILTEIIKKKHPVLQEYVGNCYAFRGYAHAALEMHENAVRDLHKASKIQCLDSASEFNLMISQAIVLFEKKKDQSLIFIQKAKEMYNKNPEPYLIESFIYFSMKNHQKCVNLLTAAISLKPGDSDLHFYRAIVNYEEGRHSESIHDLDIAIDKSEENNLFHYLCRGLNYASLCMYQEALSDFSAVLQIESSFHKAYMYRGRCAFLQDDINLAYTEFQKLLFENPEDPEAHIHAGDLLLLNNCVKDALKAYKNSLAQAKTSKAFIRCTKCFIIMGDLKKAVEELADLLTIENNKQLLQDFNVLKGLEAFEARSFKEALKVFSEISKDGSLISAREASKFLALSYFFTGDYKHAVSIFKERKNEELADQDDCTFNLILCYLQIQQFELAMTHLNELAYITSGEDKPKILYFIGLLHLSLQNEADGKDFIQAAKKLAKILKSQENDEIELFPFSTNSEYSLKFPTISLKIGSKTLKTRPSFNLPTVDLPVFDFPVDSSIVQQFSLKSIKCKPEAPWLNRVHGMIQFTDEVQDIQSETVTDSLVDQQEDLDEDIFAEEAEEFKKYRSAICLPRQGTDKLFESIKAVLEE